MKSIFSTSIKFICTLSLVINIGFGEIVEHSASTDDQTKERIYKIDTQIELDLKEIISEQDKVKYLISIINSEQEETKEFNFKKSSAIRLLGEYGGTNAISVLVENLDYLDNKYRHYPAVVALGAIGNSATEPLLQAVKSVEDSKKIANAVQALIMIKGDGYVDFVDKQKEKMPHDSWLKLVKYAVD